MVNPMSCNRPWMKNIDGRFVLIPCGWCMQCRIDKRNAWTDRIGFELKKNDGAFVTLTYDEDNMPSDYGLHKDHVQKFLKRLRKNLSGRKIKYYAVGEYGSLGTDLNLYDTGFGRPHYHLIIIGLSPLYDEKYIKKSWPFGFIKCLPANRSTVRYTLKYLEKQIHGKKAEEVYGALQPPFSLVSQGIGLEWLKKNQETVSEIGGYYVNGRFRPAPRYYKDKLGIDNSTKINSVKLKRIKDYMQRFNCTYEKAVNDLGMINERDIITKNNLH